MRFFKAIIPAAGLGERLHPVTKVLPKEMFPVGRNPAIEWVIAEAVNSGCREIAVVISPRKQVIREYLENHSRIPLKFCELTFIIQSEPLGLGHALILAKEFTAGQPVAILLPDDLTTGPRPPLVQMKDAFTRMGGAVFALVPDDASENIPRWSERWHLIKAEEQIYKVQPSRKRAPSDQETIRFAGIGRYLLSPECLDYASTLLDKHRQSPLDDGDIFEFMCAADKPVHGYVFEGRRFDISTVAGYIDALQTLGNSDPLSLFPQIPAI